MFAGIVGTEKMGEESRWEGMDNMEINLVRHGWNGYSSDTQTDNVDWEEACSRHGHPLS